MPLVLVANHDRDILALYGAVLEEIGYVTVLHLEVEAKPEMVIASGADAVVIDAETPETIASDVRVIEVLRADPATYKVPIILCVNTSKQLASAAERLRELDVPVLSKPLRIDELSQLLGRVLAPTPSLRLRAG